MNVKSTPLYEALQKNREKEPISFHVPGHKYGQIYKGEDTGFLGLDATEISGLDDLHAPEGVIRQAQEQAADFFGSEETFFLVNGTTVGNMALLLTVCGPGDEIIVQRNCHKSVLNGIELAGAKPVFIAPEFEEDTSRYSQVTPSSIQKALDQYPESRAVFLTYPDYFGRAYPLREIASVVHSRDIPLLIDEAHGVHFHLGPPFPEPALKAGVDAVVQSAHKMAPAMTMASYLHIKSCRVSSSRLRHYLQMLQSSSPSYPLMASLDLARDYLQQWSKEDRDTLVSFIKDVRAVFEHYPEHWRVLPVTPMDDTLKIVLEPETNTGFVVADVLEKQGLVPEMASTDQVLLVLGLEPYFSLANLKKQLAFVDNKLKKTENHATIKQDQISFPPIQTLEWSYSEMRDKPVVLMDWNEAEGQAAAEAIIPYPPGIPLVLKGERLSSTHIQAVHSLVEKGARFQNLDMATGVRVFKGE
ncbi:aminotransferase class I/II-fold pyridoxal phosphate-dependent enzyme [Halobacillus kuroshimensis]|uniref:aminotransferase class I/II-fold pyridoxal phosphate-dependent enzyme n=1 Tax=Halobacillus kuroshimensis TaxID=302481 RepID=UPI00040A4D9B|nr:aminotransferase class I/II-fold pyridoxal phosphate-dependent enzyme [Halobacillus kuroshimensis]